MGEYIVKGAKAICKYGTSVGQLQVMIIQALL